MAKSFISIIITVLISAILIAAGAYYVNKYYLQKIPIQDTSQAAKFQNLDILSGLLVRMYIHGGLCATGECSTTKTINRDGTVLVDGRFRKKLNGDEVARLKNLIESADFAAVRSQKFTGICPTAYDGSEVIYTFYTRGGQETISSCEVVVDQTHPLFSQIRLILGD